MSRLVRFSARLLGSPAFRRAVHTAGVLLIAAAQLLGIWG